MTSLLRIERPARVAVVTAGLSATGAVFGAVCASSSVAIIAVLAQGLDALAADSIPPLLGVAAAFGGLVGILGAPLLGWGLLRRVPLGRVLLTTSVGTVLGAVGGEWARALDPYPRLLPGVLAGALLGFVLAGIGLAVHSRSARATSTDGGK
jgi:hypothetical protein